MRIHFAEADPVHSSPLGTIHFFMVGHSDGKVVRLSDVQYFVVSFGVATGESVNSGRMVEFFIHGVNVENVDSFLSSEFDGGDSVHGSIS